MTTNTDIKEYPSNDPYGKVVKTVTINGSEGKQIKIEAVSLQLYSGKEGVTNNTVVAINGVDWAAWNYKTSAYSSVLTYNKYPFIVDIGKDAKITWKVKTSDKQYTAKIKNASYTYSLEDIVVDKPVINDKKCLVVIECNSEDDAKLRAEEIKKKYSDILVYIQS